MAENPESLLSALNAGSGVGVPNGADSAVEAMRRQIQVHDNTNQDKTVLDKMVEVVWHKDDQTLAHLKGLETQVGQESKQGDNVGLSLLKSQITAATKADQSEMQTQNSVEFYAGSFLKAVPLFAGRSKLLMAASVGVYALDAVHMKDTGGQVVADLALGGLKGFALKKTFDVLGSKQLNLGAEGSLLSKVAPVAGIGAKGVAIGGLSRLYDTGLNRQSWVNQKGEVDAGQALSIAASTTLDWRAMALDATLFVGAHGAFTGMAKLGSSAIEASPVLQKLESSALGSFIKDTKMLPSATMGATFGFSSGAVGEFSRERQSSDGIDLGKIIKRGAYQALTDAAAGATGATATHMSEVSWQQTADNGASKASPDQQMGMAFAGRDATRSRSGGEQNDRGTGNRELPSVKAASALERALPSEKDTSGAGRDLPNLKLETFSLADLENVRAGDKPLTKAEWQTALRSGKFAVMLSGGGQQGYHHMGFMAALGEMGLRPLQVTGVSAGSTFHVLDMAKDPSVKWEANNPADKEILPSLIKALKPGSFDSQGAKESSAPERAALRERLQALAAGGDKAVPIGKDKALADFLTAAKQTLIGKHILDETFDTHPKGRPQIDLTDLAWQNSNPYMKLWTGQDLGDGAMHGLPRVDLTELWWNNPFNVWRYALGAEVPQGIPHITAWDGSQLDMLPAFKALDKRLDLQALNGPESSFLAYDVENQRVVNFQGGQGKYDVSTALAASTAVNIDGRGVKPVEAIINGQHSRLVDLGVVQAGRFNSPTGQLPQDMPALVSQLPRPASPRRPNDMVVDFAAGQRPPFPLVNDNDVLQMFANGYVETMRMLAPYVAGAKPSVPSETAVRPAPTSLAIH
jgi:hypothetical protein